MRQDAPIVCLGIMVADLIGGPLQALPKRARLVLVDNMGLFTGGCAVNTASALARLGLPVSLIGKVGADPLGDFLLAALGRRQVQVRGVQRDRHTGTSATMVMVDPDGERRFIHYLGANATLCQADVDLATIREAAILHVAGCFVMPQLDGQPTATILREAKQAGVTTFLDTAWDTSGQWQSLLSPCLPFVDYMVPSLVEARHLTGFTDPEDVARALREQGVGTVALKMGRQGCLVLDSTDKPFRVQAFQVEAVDATGAGDAFAAGFIAGVYLGWTLEETARLANAAGAICVTGMGALGNISSLEDTIEFMSTNELVGSSR